METPPNCNFLEAKEIGMYNAVLEDIVRYRWMMVEVLKHDDKATERFCDEILTNIDAGYHADPQMFTDEQVRHLTRMICQA